MGPCVFVDEPLPYNEGIIEMSVYGPCVFVDEPLPI